MKKRFVLSAAALGAASFMMLSGFDSAETAESVVQKAQEATASLTEVSAKVDMAANISVEIPDAETTLDLEGQGNMDVAVSLDPLAAAVSGSFSGSALGMGGSMDMATYMVTEEDGTIAAYSGTDGEWTKTVLDAETADQIRAAIEKSAALNESDAPFTYTLDSAPVDINGTECYKLTASLTWDDIKELMTWSLEKAKEMTADDAENAELGEELDSAFAEVDSYLEMADPYAAGLVLNVEMDIATDTFYQVRLHIDMDGSDWSNLEMLTATLLGMTTEDDELMDVNFNISELYMDYYYDLTAPVSVEVPAEVIETAVEVSAEDLAEVLEGAVEEDTEA